MQAPFNFRPRLSTALKAGAIVLTALVRPIEDTPLPFELLDAESTLDHGQLTLLEEPITTSLSFPLLRRTKFRNSIWHPLRKIAPLLGRSPALLPSLLSSATRPWSWHLCRYSKAESNSVTGKRLGRSNSYCTLDASTCPGL